MYMRVYKSINCEHMYIIHSKDCFNYTSKINCDGSYQNISLKEGKMNTVNCTMYLIVNEDTSKCTNFL